MYAKCWSDECSAVCDQEPESPDENRKKENWFSLSHSYHLRAGRRFLFSQSNNIILNFTFSMTNNRSSVVETHTLHETNYNWLTMGSLFDHFCSSNWILFFFRSCILRFSAFFLAWLSQDSQVISTELCKPRTDINMLVYMYVRLYSLWGESSSSSRARAHTFVRSLDPFTCSTIVRQKTMVTQRAERARAHQV